ncbi:PHD finger protein ALFIN-LIKE 2 isoform X2 [Setaria italica]|uniref:PHD finger protein ALFIN-LIKE 2 isoform X2 n=1 Tax=Setaria italica TaxID=4555 RepID=UPI000BE60B76|nr:PHD finger protein ALFIN-LIKE 2 isoform X2 [Setaria italica]
METPPAAAPAPLPPPARPSTPSYTVECIFRDFTCRRAALIRALTTDEKAFSRKYNAGTESLYLYGNSDGNWELRPPKLLMPPGQPDPRMFGIKLVRGNMKHPKWLAYIATHCDAWLIRISFFLGANLGTQASRSPIIKLATLARVGPLSWAATPAAPVPRPPAALRCLLLPRQHLSALINSLQTVHEAFVASDTYHRICHLEKMNVEIEDEDEGCGTEPTVCASCGNHYRRNGFWICCDECDRWFHGKCVKVTAAQAEHIGHYECPECCSDKKGHDYNVDPLLSVLYKRY